MKKIVLALSILFTLALTSCDNIGKRYNSSDCKTRFDVQMADGSALWVYGVSMHDGYLSGNDEQGQDVYVPLSQVRKVTEVPCHNGVQ